MLEYIIIFSIIGAFLGVFTTKIAAIIILVITICWAFVMGPWALATLIELVIGYAIGSTIVKEIKNDKNN